MNETTETLTLTDFLLARIAEDEAQAAETLDDDGIYGTWSHWVKAECEAKRRIVERHTPYVAEVYGHGRQRRNVDVCAYCAAMCHSSSGLSCDEPTDGAFPCVDVLDLATVYADHPDYDPAWRP